MQYDRELLNFMKLFIQYKGDLFIQIKDNNSGVGDISTTKLKPGQNKGCAIRGRRKVQPLKRQFQKIKCHLCRTQDADQNYYICCNYPECKRGFCAKCLRKNYGKHTSQIKRSYWQCPVCEGKCNCGRCLAPSEVQKNNMENHSIPVRINETKPEMQPLPPIISNAVIPQTIEEEKKKHKNKVY